MDTVRNSEHRDFREFLSYRLLYQGIFKEEEEKEAVLNIFSILNF